MKRMAGVLPHFEAHDSPIQVVNGLPVQQGWCQIKNLYLILGAKYRVLGIYLHLVF